MSIELIVGAATEAVFSYLLSESGFAHQIRQRIQPDPLKAAFALALTRAFNQFAECHPDLALALFDQHLLTRPAVSQLLAQSLLRDAAPDPALLASHYAEQLAGDPVRRAALQAKITPAAADFLNALRTELRARTEFQALFDSQALDQVAQHTGTTASDVAAMRHMIEQLLQALRELTQRIAVTHGQGDATAQPTQPVLPEQAGLLTFGQAGDVHIDTVAGGHVFRIGTLHLVLPQGPTESPPIPDAAGIPTPSALGGRAKREKPNPFIAGIAVPPERFYGRTHERQAIKSRIGSLTAQSISLVGHFRSGKTSLLEYVLQRTSEFCPAAQSPVVAKISLADSRYRSALGINEGLRRAIKQATGAEPWASDENSDTYALEDGFARLARQGRRTILLIDEFQAFDDKQKFYKWGNDWRCLAENPRLALALVIASHRPLPAIYAEQQVSSPFGNLFFQERLSLFAPSEVQGLLRDGFATNDEQPSPADEALVVELSGGWPFYVQLAASLLWELNDHNAVRREFAAQVKPHFARLWKHLDATEQAALRAMLSGGSPSSAMHTELSEQGLLCEDGRVFSRAFVDFLREHDG